jgi:hypothetical protein
VRRPTAICSAGVSTSSNTVRECSTVKAAHCVLLGPHFREEAWPSATEKEVVGLLEVGLGPGLDELVRHGARQVIQQATEAELSTLLERFENAKTLNGQCALCAMAICQSSKC